MNLFKQRISEVEQALHTQKLLSADELVHIQGFKTAPSKKPRDVLELKRKDHSLKVVAFPDGAVVVFLQTLYEEPTGIMLIAMPNSPTWCVQVDPNLPHRCSGMLLDLWSKMPKRKNVDKGTFTKPNGLLALRRMIEGFAGLEAN